jgi:hypothetical protein
VLPDGNYTGKILAGLPDFFGNPLPADANFSFFFLNGDASRDRVVNIADFAILAANFNRPGTFTTGDFNYNGTVEIGDFAILATRFNLTLPPAEALPGRSLPGFKVPSAVFSDVRVVEVLEPASGDTV